MQLFPNDVIKLNLKIFNNYKTKSSSKSNYIWSKVFFI